MFRMSSHFVHSALLWITCQINIEMPCLGIIVISMKTNQLVGEDTVLLGHWESVGSAQARNFHGDPVSCPV